MSGAGAGHSGKMPVLDDAAERTYRMCADFRAHFRRGGYQELAEIPVTTRVDASVFFVGSIMNVVKHRLLEGRLAAEGIFMSQTCLRTHNLQRLSDSLDLPDRCSVFATVGAVVPTARTDDLARDSASWLASLDYSLTERLVIWLSSADEDLENLVHTSFGAFDVEYDTQPVNRYRHSYGAPGLVGRNFNFGIRTTSGFADQIGNFVLISLDGVPVAAEIGLSVPVVLSLCHDLGHPMLASTAAETMSFDGPADIILADCLTISQLLLSEGMRPRADGRNKYLRFALRGASRLLDMSSNDLGVIWATVRNMYARQGRDHEDFPDRVVRYIELSRKLAQADRRDIPGTVRPSEIL